MLTIPWAIAKKEIRQAVRKQMAHVWRLGHARVHAVVAIGQLH